MVLLSGEVETTGQAGCRPPLEIGFRMVLLSGEVETSGAQLFIPLDHRSGWFCYPGKLKPTVPCRNRVSSPLLVPDGFAIRGS